MLGRAAKRRLEEFLVASSVELRASNYIPADSTLSQGRILEIIVTTFGSIRVIRLSGTVVVGVIMAMCTIFHHLVETR